MAQSDLDTRQLLVLTPLFAWVLATCVWLLLMIYCVFVGWPQKKVANGTLLRLLGVSAFLGMIGAFPTVVVAAFSLRGPVLADQCCVAAGSTFISLIFFASFLLPPVILRGTKQKLPLVTDERFLRRVVSMSEKMHITVPSVRLRHSVTGTQQALAFAGTLQAPQLVVTDGILHRLESSEGDAIVAHELGHIANGSLFLLAAVIPVSGAVTTAVSWLLPMSLAIPFGFAFLVGFRRLLSRPIEFDCDYRAARVMGFRVTASALAKIYAVHPISNSGVLSLLLYAAATHPSRDVRLAALYTEAPLDDRPEAIPDAALIRRHHWAAKCATSIWFFALFGTVVISASGRTDTWLAIPLWVVALAPQTMVRLALQKQLQIAKRRTGSRWGILAGLGLVTAIAFAIIIVVVVLVALLQDLVDEGNSAEVLPRAVLYVTVIGTMVIGPFCFWSMSMQKRRKLQREVVLAFQLHDFRRVTNLCVAAPKIVQRSHKLRYNLAIADAVCGNRQEAIDALERLWDDKPRFPLAALALGALLLDTDRAERAVEVAKSVGLLLPRDPAVPLLEARSLRRLGLIDEAQVACDQAMEFEPNNGCVHAIAAAIQLDRGHLERAETLVARGLNLAPGDPYVLVVRAEISLRVESAEQARSAIAQAIQAVSANPLAFLQTEIMRLEAPIT